MHKSDSPEFVNFLTKSCEESSPCLDAAEAPPCLVAAYTGDKHGYQVILLGQIKAVNMCLNTCKHVSLGTLHKRQIGPKKQPGVI